MDESDNLHNFQVWGYLGAQLPSGSKNEDLKPNTSDFPDPLVNGTGANFRNHDSNTLTLLLSGRDRPSNTGKGWYQQVSVVSRSCPPEGCPPPSVAKIQRDMNIRCEQSFWPPNLPYHRLLQTSLAKMPYFTAIQIAATPCQWIEWFYFDSHATCVREMLGQVFKKIWSFWWDRCSVRCFCLMAQEQSKSDFARSFCPTLQVLEQCNNVGIPPT
jgi:hypothetical protein